jgi:outer membrane protein OmpA-like peptidoglycan-associated protein
MVLSPFITGQSDTLRLYYAINEEMSKANFEKIDSLLISTINIQSLKILGYADFLHHDDYNLALSQRRADKIKDYLLQKSPGIKISICKGYGEKFSGSSEHQFGEPFQRRVDVIIENSLMSKNLEKERRIKTPKDTTTTARTLENLGAGEKLAIEGLNFEPGRHYIMKSSVPVLQKLLTTLKKNPKLKIEIQGHVCCTEGTGDGYDYDTHTRKLSENRARAIYEFLISRGVEKERLSYQGYGHSQPKFPDEKTAEEEQANRRVEILVVEK